jgi:hypothetical protein
MNMRNENRKFGIQTAQRRTDDTTVIGVNWPTILWLGVGCGVGGGANRTWVSEVKLEREERLA